MHRCCNSQQQDWNVSEKRSAHLFDTVRLWFLLKFVTLSFLNALKHRTFDDAFDLPLFDPRTSVSHLDFPKIVEGGLKQMLELLGDDNAPFDVCIFNYNFLHGIYSTHPF